MSTPKPEAWEAADRIRGLVSQLNQEIAAIDPEVGVHVGVDFQSCIIDKPARPYLRVEINYAKGDDLVSI